MIIDCVHICLVNHTNDSLLKSHASQVFIYEP